MSRQPIDFTARPNRNKTQKWQAARTYNYDGDDWGGYDPYDYGDYDHPAPPPMPQPGQSSRLPRQNSFDRGDERRQFSGPANLNLYSSAARGVSPARSAVSNTSSGRPSVDAQWPRPTGRPRDFTNPEEVPAPLNTRVPPMPTGPPAMASSRFPPRKSSVSSTSRSPAIPPPGEVATSPTMAQSADNEKGLPDLPFIRPSDIYKRVEEEKQKERASMESSLPPSMDSMQREASSSNAERAQPFGAERVQARPLSSVQEVPATPQSATFGQTLSKPKDSSPVLPEVSRFSGFGSDFLAGGGASLTGKQAESDLPATHAPPGADPAAQILAERQHATPVTQVGRQPDELAHQPSLGYRSMVHQAFDSKRASDSFVPQTPLSHDGSQSTSDFTRSNTTSSSVISPIMSRVPSGATAQQRQLELEPTVSTIAEEAPQSQSELPSEGIQTVPSRPVGHSRDASAGSAAALSALGIQPGYRRSYHAPSGDNSPAHVAGVEDTQNRRLSQPLAAETFEHPDRLDDLTDVQTSSSEMPSGADDIPRTGRPRAGTDYSIREADIAQEVNLSPEAAAQEKANQSLFLSTHLPAPTSAVPPALQSTAAPDDSTVSSSKGRAREIVGKYTEIHNTSRSNSITSSKSSWSNFRGSDENLALRRNGTDTYQLGGSEGDEDLRPLSLTPSGLGVSRPEATRGPSFRPHLPGEWVSFSRPPESGVLASASASAAHQTDRDITPRASQVPRQPEIDPTPTTERVPLEDTHAPGSETTGTANDSFFTQAKNAGGALGAALMSTVGVGHRTHDFASPEPAPQVEQPDTKLRAGDIGDLMLRPPPIRRGDSDMTNVTDVCSVPATPTAIDNSRDLSNAAYDDERVRREIEETLSFDKEDGLEENRERTQDALDAPANAARVDAELTALPPVEARPRMLDQRFSWEKSEDAVPTASVAISIITEPAPQPPPQVQEPEHSPEIKPEMPYERPRSRNLHLMNANSSDDEADVATPQQATGGGLMGGLPVGAPPGDPLNVDVSPLGKSEEDLNSHLSPTGRQFSVNREQKELMPSPVSDSISTRLPSYYMQDHSPIAGGENEQVPELREVRAEPESKGNVITTTRTVPVASETSSPTKTNKKIPPFREILAIKSAPERITAYDETRQTFADMNTGLGDWLSSMLAEHPEYANLSTSATSFKAPALQTSSTGGFGSLGHRKNSASIALKFCKVGDPQQRSGSLDASDSAAPRTPAKDFVGNAVDMDKMQQRGKDLMKSAGVLGGKAQVGAKGLLAKSAKGFSRFGAKRESSGGAGGVGKVRSASGE